MRAVAVPEHEHLALWAQLLGGSRETGGHGLVHEAAGIGGIQRHTYEVVRRRVTQVDDCVGDDSSDVDEACRARLVASGGTPALGAFVVVATTVKSGAAPGDAGRR